MTTSIFYYPVLKWKAGERTALKELYDHQKQVIIPIIEVINQVSASDFVDELASFPGPVVVDTIHLDDDNELLIEILNQAHRKGKQLIPLLYVSNIGAPSIRTFSKTNIVAIAIPIAEDIEGPDQQEIFRRISASFKDSRVDLILDLGIMTQRRRQHRICATEVLFEVLWFRIISVSSDHYQKFFFSN